MPQATYHGIGAFQNPDGLVDSAQLDADKNLKVNVVTGGGTGGTSSTFGAAFPGTGTAAGFLDDGGNMAPGNLDASGNLKVVVSGAGSAVTIADGADVAEGATTDAKVTGDNDGTVSAKLRGLNTIEADVWDSVNHRWNVAVGNTVTVTGPLTDTQLRASAVPVSAATLPLPTGAATLAEQQTQTASLSVLDDWDESDRAKVNPIVGQAGIQGGAGAVSANTTRVAIATDANTVQVTGTVTTAEAAPATVLNGKKTVTTAGTRVTLAGSTAAKSVTIKALIGNTGVIYVGDSSVASTNGFALNPGDTISLAIANLSTVNLDSSVNGEGVTYLGVV